MSTPSSTPLAATPFVRITDAEQIQAIREFALNSPFISHHLTKECNTSSFRMDPDGPEYLIAAIGQYYDWNQDQDVAYWSRTSSAHISPVGRCGMSAILEAIENGHELDPELKGYEMVLRLNDELEKLEALGELPDLQQPDGLSGLGAMFAKMMDNSIISRFIASIMNPRSATPRRSPLEGMPGYLDVNELLSRFGQQVDPDKIDAMDFGLPQPRPLPSWMEELMENAPELPLIEEAPVEPSNGPDLSFTPVDTGLDLNDSIDWGGAEPETDPNDLIDWEAGVEDAVLPRGVTTDAEWSAYLADLNEQHEDPTEFQDDGDFVEGEVPDLDSFFDVTAGDPHWLAGSTWDSDKADSSNNPMSSSTDDDPETEE